MKNIVIAGAGSAIAQATARIWASQDASFFLIDRNAELLETVAADLRVRTRGVVAYELADLTDCSAHNTLLERGKMLLSGIDIVLVAQGVLPNQEEAQTDWERMRISFEINMLSVISFVTEAAHTLSSIGGTIAVLSSVAGDRGRKSNYIYGSAKGGVTLFVDGLRHRLRGSDIHVLTIKPGQVDTPMTAGFEKGILWTSPDRVARDVVRAIEQRKPVLYTPWYWRWIMFVIRHIPERIFVKLNL